MTTKIQWQSAYDEAFLETDNYKLTERVHLAEEAIFARLRTMPIAERDERLAMQKALTALDILRRERLGKLA